MKVKKILYGDDARKALAEGVRKVNDAVSTSLGPSGLLSLIAQEGKSSLTKDGITIAKNIRLEDIFENEGAKLAIEVSSKTNEVAGDGTTTSLTIGNALVKEGIKYVTNGGSASFVKAGIDLAVEHIIEYIEENSKPVRTKQDVEYIASIAGNDSEVGAMIANAMDAIGLDGIVTIEDSQTSNDELDVVNGLQFDRGFVSSNLVTNHEKMTVEFESPYVFLYDGKIQSPHQIIGIMEKVANQPGKGILLIADEFDKDTIATLVLNKVKSGLHICAIRSPGFGNNRKNILQDIAVITGATLISSELGLTPESTAIEDLGTVKKLIVEKDITTMIEGGGNKEEIIDRCTQLRSELEKAQSNYDREQIQKRLSALSGGVAVVRVGGVSEQEQGERRDRYVDAYCAAKAGVEDGCVIGGGATLLKASEILDSLEIENDEIKAGVNIVKKALRAPILTIAKNAGKSGEVIADTILKSDKEIGYNAVTNEFVNMFDAGIVDAAKVTKSALRNAASIATLILMTQCVIAQEPDEEKIDMMF